MNADTTSASPLSPGTRRLPHQNLEAAVVGTLMLLAAGTGTLAMAGSRETVELSPGPSAVQPAAVPAAAFVSEAVPASTPETTWVYVVGSEGEAAPLRQAAASVPGAPSVVIVAGSREQAEWLVNFELSLNSIREASGRGSVNATVVEPLGSGQ